MMADNLTWAEEDVNLWKGWTYSPEKNRYYFNDIGNESLAAFWADEFLNQAYSQNRKLMIKSKEWRVSNRVWASAGFNPRRIALGFSVDRFNANIDFLWFWVTLEY